MMRFQLKDYGFFLTLLFVAMALMILPVPRWLLICQPNWVLLVLIFWLSAAPQSIGVFFLWCVGLFQDILLTEPLGMTATTYVIVGFLVARTGARITQYASMQRGLLFFGVALLAAVLHSVSWACLGRGGGFWILIPSVITTSLFGVIIYDLLYYMWQRRLKVY